MYTRKKLSLFFFLFFNFVFSFSDGGVEEEVWDLTSLSQLGVLTVLILPYSSALDCSIVLFVNPPTTNMILKPISASFPL